MEKQQTIKKETKTSGGVNVYTGEMISIKFSPARSDEGIIFIINGKKIKASIEGAKIYKNSIFVGEIGVTEHILAPIYALGIDNLYVEVDFLKKPFAFPFFSSGCGEIFSTLKEAGITEQGADKKYLAIEEKHFFKHHDKNKKDSLLVTPDDNFIIDYRIFFPFKAVGEQNFSFLVSPEKFGSDVMEARSPAFVARDDLSSYLISEKTHLLVGAEDNEEYLNLVRYGGQEFVRHKALDFLGTLALFGRQFKNTRFKVNMSGHAFDLSVLKQMKKNNYLKTL